MNLAEGHSRIAVLGAAGQLGSELVRLLGSRAIPLTRARADLSKPSEIIHVLHTLNPDSVINAAAYTRVDQAESERDLCGEINATAVGYLAQACRELACPLVQISTDYVFGGDRTRMTPYREDELPAPVNWYGHTKLEGERFAAEWERYFIVRTCGLYVRPTPWTQYHNFVATMLRLARERGTIRVVNDQHCTPSYVPHVGRAILHLLSTETYGTYHIVQEGATTWAEFAAEIFRLSGLPTKVVPISSSEYPTPAARPGYSVLDSGEFGHLAGAPMPSWQEALADCLPLTGDPARHALSRPVACEGEA